MNGGKKEFKRKVAYIFEKEKVDNEKTRVGEYQHIRYKPNSFIQYGVIILNKLLIGSRIAKHTIIKNACKGSQIPHPFLSITPRVFQHISVGLSQQKWVSGTIKSGCQAPNQTWCQAPSNQGVRHQVNMKKAQFRRHSRRNWAFFDQELLVRF